MLEDAKFSMNRMNVWNQPGLIPQPMQGTDEDEDLESARWGLKRGPGR
jgi:hypothetical protein